MSNSLPQKQKFSVAISTPGYQKLITNTLRDPKRASRFIASITSAVATTPALQECEASTIISGALLGESLNLSPSPQLGQYYLVPFKDNKAGVTKAQFILGYKGYIQLAIRSGYYKDIDAIPIHEGEYLGRDKRTGKPIFEFLEDADEAESRPVVGYMAYFEYENGFTKTVYWSFEKMLSHADHYSKAFSAEAYKNIKAGKISDKDLWKYSSFWYKDFDSMALKTLLRQLISKWGIMSIEMQTAFESEDKIIRAQEDGIFTQEEAEIEPVTVQPAEQPAVEVEPIAVKQASLDDF